MKYLAIVLLSMQLVGATLVPGTEDTWTDGVDTWRGSPFCKEAGFILQPDSPAILPDGSFIGACSAFLTKAVIPAPTGLGVE